MSLILLQKLVSNEINLNTFKSWLLSQSNENDFNCSQSEFLTYFLNVLHEDINSQKKFGEQSQRCTPRKIKSDTRPEPSTSVVKSLDKSFSEIAKEINNTNTPKGTKLNLNSSYYSPVSPLYRQQSSKSKPKKHDISLGDFLCPKTPSEKRISLEKQTDNTSKKLTSTPLRNNNSSKKITPTTIKSNDKSNDDFGKRITPTPLRINNSFHSMNSFNNFNTKELSSNDCNENRLFLVKERSKILSKKDSDESVALVNIKKLSISENRCEVVPKLNLVTYKDELNIIANIYTIILDNNLVLNITGEIYFLISLILTKQYTDVEELQLGVNFLNETNNLNFLDYFETVHNIVYFSIKVLETQFNILKYYDKSTLKLLSINQRITEFSVKFSEKLRKLSDMKSDRIIEEFDENINTNVTYNLDTDTKNNFPNDVSFLSFRKQRDLFYEILRIWEKNHLQPGWNFQIGLEGKIKSLLSLQNDSANYMHFARLFKAQLLSSCGRSLDVENNPLPSSFPDIDPSKLNRLKNRLVTKQCSNGLNTPPHFTGHQEFYKDFIIMASNHSFNTHLCDAFIYEIISLNGNSFTSSQIEESGDDTDVVTRKAYALNLRYLRVLAKFLGFVESLPYKLDVNKFPENMFNHYINIKEKKLPQLDIKQLLIDSIKHNTVILTVPWIVKYLSMLDYITLRLPYYLLTYEVLFQIYHSYEKSNKKFDYNASLVKFSLGWLFDLPHFPDTEYNKFCSTRNVHFIRKANTLDSLDIVDQDILYSCCIYLDEIKKILTNSTEHRNITIKHITPVTAVQSSEQISKKRLEQQLEEAFFNGQPESVRKTVEFVSERLASASVKHICNTVVPLYKKDSLETIKDFLETQKEHIKNSFDLIEKNQKIDLRMRVTELIQEKISTLRKMCGDEISTFLNTRIPTTIENLLAIDTLPQTKISCISITSRMCTDRVKQWINTHITVNIFMKEVDKELQKVFNLDSKKIIEEKAIFQLPPYGSKEKHNEDSLSGFHLVESIRIMCLDLLEDSENINKSSIEKLLLSVYQSLQGRCDLNDIIISVISTSLLNLALLLIAHRPNLMQTIDQFNDFVTIWKINTKSTDDLFKDLLCPKNLALLEKSSDQNNWNNFGMFVAYLVKMNIISSDNIERQCTAFFRKDWDESILNNVCYFMKCFVKYYKQNGGDHSKFTLLLEFLSEFCMEL